MAGGGGARDPKLRIVESAGALASQILARTLRSPVAPGHDRRVWGGSAQGLWESTDLPDPWLTLGARPALGL